MTFYMLEDVDRDFDRKNLAGRFAGKRSRQKRKINATFLLTTAFLD